MPRDYSIREHQLVTEWVTSTYPHADYVGYRVRLGAFDPTLQDAGLTETEIRRLGVRRRWADAVVSDHGTTHVIEGKLRSRPGALEQLDMYEVLVPLTPELDFLRLQPVEKHLVWSIRDPVVESLARSRSIQVHYFHPDWVTAYEQLLPHRETTPTPLHGVSLSSGVAPSDLPRSALGG